MTAATKAMGRRAMVKIVCVCQEQPQALIQRALSNKRNRTFLWKPHFSAPSGDKARVSSRPGHCSTNVCSKPNAIGGPRSQPKGAQIQLPT
jgi:hypothetical protein